VSANCHGYQVKPEVVGKLKANEIDVACKLNVIQ
jgi:hypothetical protein